MTTEQRLNRIEDEFETVKQLLASAALHAQSATEGLDRLTEKQDRTQTQLDQLTVTVEGISQKIDSLNSAQTHTQAQLDQLTEKVNQVSSRVDEFVFQVQRLFTQQADRLIRLEGQTERLEALFQLLNRNYEGQQSQLQEFQRTTGAALERIDRVLDYLLKQNPGN
jgi:chromosome segregation ATPase